MYIRQEIEGYSPDIPQGRDCYVGTRQLVLNGIYHAFGKIGVLEPPLLAPGNIHFCRIQTVTSHEVTQRLKREMGFKLDEVIVILPPGEPLRENVVNLFASLDRKQKLNEHETEYIDGLQLSFRRAGIGKVRIKLPMTANDRGDLFIDGRRIKASSQLKAVEECIYLGNAGSEDWKPRTLLTIAVEPDGYDLATGTPRQGNIFLMQTLMPALDNVTVKQFPSGRNGETDEQIVFSPEPADKPYIAQNGSAANGLTFDDAWQQVEEELGKKEKPVYLSARALQKREAEGRSRYKAKKNRR